MGMVKRWRQRQRLESGVGVVRGERGGMEASTSGRKSACGVRASCGDGQNDILTSRSRSRSCSGRMRRSRGRQVVMMMMKMMTITRCYSSSRWRRRLMPTSLVERHVRCGAVKNLRGETVSPDRDADAQDVVGGDDSASASEVMGNTNNNTHGGAHDDDDHADDTILRRTVAADDEPDYTIEDIPLSKLGKNTTLVVDEDIDDLEDELEEIEEIDTDVDEALETLRMVSDKKWRALKNGSPRRHPLKDHLGRKVRIRDPAIDLWGLGMWRDLAVYDQYTPAPPAYYYSDEDIERLEEEGPQTIDDLRIKDSGYDLGTLMHREWAKMIDNKTLLTLDAALYTWFGHFINHGDGKDGMGNENKLLDRVGRLKKLDAATKGKYDHVIRMKVAQFWDRFCTMSTARAAGAWERHLYDGNVPMSVLGVNAEDIRPPEWHTIREIPPTELIRVLRKRQWLSETFDENASTVTLDVWYDTSDPLGFMRSENPLRRWGLFGKNEYSGFDVRVILSEEGRKPRYVELSFIGPNTATLNGGNDVGLNQVMEEIEKCFIMRVPEDESKRQMETEMHYWTAKSKATRDNLQLLDFAREFSGTGGESELRERLSEDGFELNANSKPEEVLAGLAGLKHPSHKAQGEGDGHGSNELATDTVDVSADDALMSSGTPSDNTVGNTDGGGGSSSNGVAGENEGIDDDEDEEIDIDEYISTKPTSTFATPQLSGGPIDKFVTYPVMRVIPEDYTENVDVDESDDDVDITSPYRVEIQQYRHGEELPGKSIKEFVLDQPKTVQQDLWFLIDHKYAKSASLLRKYFGTDSLRRLLTGHDVRALHGGFDFTGTRDPHARWMDNYPEIRRRNWVAKQMYQAHRRRSEARGSKIRADGVRNEMEYPGRPGDDEDELPPNVFEVFDDEELLMLGMSPHDDPDIKWQSPKIYSDTLRPPDRTEEDAAALLYADLSKGPKWIDMSAFPDGTAKLTPGKERVHVNFHQMQALQYMPLLAPHTKKTVMGTTVASAFITVISYLLMKFSPVLSEKQISNFRINEGEPLEASVAVQITQSKGDIRREGQTEVYFSDVGGVNHLLDELDEIADYLKYPGKYRRVGAIPPKGILFEGPPGTGKTLIAKALANEAGLPFLAMTGNDFVLNQLEGVGAARIRDLFKRAKANSPCIIFVDEMDALGASRGSKLKGGGAVQENEATLNQLLSCLDGFESETGTIFIGSTNRADLLDPALLRPGRFDRKMYVGPPDVQGREDVLRIKARAFKVVDDYDFRQSALDTPGFTGAQLENCLNESALIAARKRKPALDNADFREALDRILLGTPKLSLFRPETFTTKITALHESGHAIVAAVLRRRNKDCVLPKIERVTITPRETKITSTAFARLQADDYILMNVVDLKNRMAVLLAGRIAEQVVNGERNVSTYGIDDIQNASIIAYRIATTYGMDEQLGVTSKSEDTMVACGDKIARNYDSMSGILAGIDLEATGNATGLPIGNGTGMLPPSAELEKSHRAVRRILEEVIAEVSSILQEYRPVLETLTSMLLERPFKSDVKGHEIEALLDDAEAQEQPSLAVAV